MHEGGFSMLRWLLTVLVICCALTCVGCPCTMIGCSDYASVIIHGAEWRAAPLTVEIEIDGKGVKCAALTLNHSVMECDDSRVNVWALADCANCKPSDPFVLRIDIDGTPQCIDVAVKKDEIVVGQRHFEPTYITET